MNEADNPYFNLLGMIQRKESYSPFLIGRVTAASPLRIQAGDILISEGNMKINRSLLQGYAREMRAEGGQTRTYTATDGLRAGDEVVLLESEDGQQFVLLCTLK